MLRASAAALTVAAVVLAGCGGGESDQDKIKSTITTYYSSFAKGDGAKACSELAKTTREDFTKAAGGKTCQDALAIAAKRPQVKRYQSQLGNPKIGKIKITGDTATAEVTAIGAHVTVPLVKEGDSWKIQGKVGESD